MACQSHGSTIFSRYSAVKASTSDVLQSPVKQFSFINRLFNPSAVVGVCQKCLDGYQACNLDMLWISHSTEDGLSGRCPAVFHFLASLLAVDEYMVSHHYSDNGCRCHHHHHHHLLFLFLLLLRNYSFYHYYVMQNADIFLEIHLIYTYINI